MTDKTKELDIAQRIAQAVANNGEPAMTAIGGVFDPDEDVILGEVPMHLRHVHNLLNEAADQAKEAETHFRDARENLDAVRSVFFNSVRQHVPNDPDKYSATKICENWQVVGVKRGENDEMDGLGAVLMAAMAGGRR